MCGGWLHFEGFCGVLQPHSLREAAVQDPSHAGSVPCWIHPLLNTAKCQTS